MEHRLSSEDPTIDFITCAHTRYAEPKVPVYQKESLLSPLAISSTLIRSKRQFDGSTSLETLACDTGALPTESRPTKKPRLLAQSPPPPTIGTLAYVKPKLEMNLPALPAPPLISATLHKRPQTLQKQMLIAWSPDQTDISQKPQSQCGRQRCDVSAIVEAHTQSRGQQSDALVCKAHEKSLIPSERQGASSSLVLASVMGCSGTEGKIICKADGRIEESQMKELAERVEACLSGSDNKMAMMIIADPTHVCAPGMCKYVPAPALYESTIAMLDLDVVSRVQPSDVYVCPLSGTLHVCTEETCETRVSSEDRPGVIYCWKVPQNVLGYVAISGERTSGRPSHLSGRQALMTTSISHEQYTMRVSKDIERRNAMARSAWKIGGSGCPVDVRYNNSGGCVKSSWIPQEDTKDIQRQQQCRRKSSGTSNGLNDDQILQLHNAPVVCSGSSKECATTRRCMCISCCDRAELFAFAKKIATTLLVTVPKICARTVSKSLKMQPHMATVAGSVVDHIPAKALNSIVNHVAEATVRAWTSLNMILCKCENCSAMTYQQRLLKLHQTMVSLSTEHTQDKASLLLLLHQRDDSSEPEQQEQLKYQQQPGKVRSVCDERFAKFKEFTAGYMYALQEGYTIKLRVYETNRRLSSLIDTAVGIATKHGNEKIIDALNATKYCKVTFAQQIAELSSILVAVNLTEKIRESETDVALDQSTIVLGQEMATAMFADAINAIHETFSDGLSSIISGSFQSSSCCYIEQRHLSTPLLSVLPCADELSRMFDRVSDGDKAFSDYRSDDGGTSNIKELRALVSVIETLYEMAASFSDAKPIRQ